MATTANETLVTLGADGTIRLPEEIRQALHIEGEMTVRLTTTVDGTLTLRPEPDIPPEDAWAYTPEHIAAVERARHSPGYMLTYEELQRLMEAEDPQAALDQFYATHTPVEDVPPHA